jgi:hypothetical protein
MTVSAKDLYATLRERLSPVLKGAGFKRMKTGKLGWYRPEGSQYAIVLVQCDKWGWFPDFGSRFSIDFELGFEPAPGSCRSVDFMCKFHCLLTPEEREMVRALNNGVLESLPSPGPNNTFHALGEDGQRLFMLDYRIRVEPYTENEHVWLQYFTARDVETWGAFFAERIVRMASDFLIRVPK